MNGCLISQGNRKRANDFNMIDIIIINIIYSTFFALTFAVKLILCNLTVVSLRPCNNNNGGSSPSTK